MLQRRCQKLAFATEVTMQQTVVDAGSGGDLANRGGGRALLREQLAGCLQNGCADLVFAHWLRRGFNRCIRCSHLCTLAEMAGVVSRLH